MRPSTACATTPASRPRQRSSTNERALVAAGHSGVISVPFGGKTTSKTSHTPSLTWISAARSGRVGEVAQDRRDPFDQERAVGIVGRPVDRAGRLRIGAGEVERDALALLDHLQRELVQLRIGDAVVLDVVLPGVFAVGDLRQQLVAEDVAALVEDGLEAGLHRLAAEALEQLRHAPRAHHAGLDLAVEIGREHVRHAGVAPDDGEHLVVAHALRCRA